MLHWAHVNRQKLQKLIKEIDVSDKLGRKDKIKKKAKK